MGDRMRNRYLSVPSTLFVLALATGAARGSNTAAASVDGSSVTTPKTGSPSAGGAVRITGSEIVGVPVTGSKGITETVEQIMAREAAAPRFSPAVPQPKYPEHEVD